MSNFNWSPTEVDRFYLGARSARKASGVILADGKVVADTQKCVHCPAQWIVVEGSKRVHGYCMTCGGPTCSSLKCILHEHRAKKR